VLGVGIGGYVVPLGFALASDGIARIGAVATIAGAASLAWYAGGVAARRGRWTTDPWWHRFVIGGLASSIAWFVVGTGIASGRILAMGAAPQAWSLDAVVGPLVVGWVALAVVASASHLLPAIGPGDPVAHARQRALLGRLAGLRLVTADAGVALLAIGIPLASGPAVGAGVLLVTAGLGGTALLLAGAIAIGLRTRRPGA
jgi:hypothetical protein